MARKKKKPASGKRKRSRKKTNKETGKAPAGEVATPAEPRPQPEDAAGAELHADAPPDEPSDAPPVIGVAREEQPDVIDLDADEPLIVDLDEDGDADDLVAALIAEAVATAPLAEEPDEPEPPMIDLDAEVEAGSADAGEDAAAEDPERVAPEPEGRDVGPARDAEEGRDTEAAGGAAGGATTTRPAAAPGDETAQEALRRLVDLGPISSPAIRDRLLAEALAHAEHKDARYRVPFSDTPTVGRWKALAGFVILLLAALVALAPPGWARPNSPAPLGEPERARNLRAALLLQAEQVEAFRVREQRLPATLDEVARALPGVRYVLSGTRAYQLIAYLPDGSAVVFDSVRPTAAFEALEPNWKPDEGAP